METKCDQKDLNYVCQSPTVGFRLCPLVLRLIPPHWASNREREALSLGVWTGVSGPGMRIVLSLSYRWCNWAWNESNNILKIMHRKSGNLAFRSRSFTLIITVVIMMMSPNIFPGSTRIQHKESWTQNQNTEFCLWSPLLCDFQQVMNTFPALVFPSVKIYVLGPSLCGCKEEWK